MVMKKIFASRIKAARIREGLSLRELSENMSGIVSHNAIKKYEDGIMMPDSKVLLALSKSLHVTTDYFFRQARTSVEQIEFRKKSRLGVKQLNSIKAKSIDIIDRYIELEEYLSISHSFSNPLARMIIRNGEDVEDAAEKLLQTWKLGLNAIPVVVDVLEDNGVKVIEFDAVPAFDGLSGFADEKIPVIVINKNFPADRKRLTALHELGHLLLSFDSDLSDKEIERLCTRFAGAILFPRRTFFMEIGRKRNKDISISELKGYKEMYGISIQAIMARARDLGVISQSRYVNFCIWINQSEHLKKEIDYEYIGHEHSSRFMQLLYRATSEEVVSLSKAASLANQKLAEFREGYIAI